MSELTFTLTAAQLALAQRAITEMSEELIRYRKKAHRLEDTPEAAQEAREECDADLQSCNELWSLLEASKVEQGMQP